MAGDEFAVKLPATDDPQEVGTVDLVLYTVKTYHKLPCHPSHRTSCRRGYGCPYAAERS